MRRWIVVWGVDARRDVRDVRRGWKGGVVGLVGIVWWWIWVWVLGGMVRRLARSNVWQNGVVGCGSCCGVVSCEEVEEEEEEGWGILSGTTACRQSG